MQYYALKDRQIHRYDKNGKRLLITRLIAQPMVVTQVKTTEKDGYQAVQVGFGTTKRVNKPLSGHLKDLAAKPRYLREVKLPSEVIKNLHEAVSATELFAIGDRISVHAVSKGAGFAGVVKRHGFAGGPKTHGQSDRHRAPGSIGQGTTPGRVYRGKRMAGHMGNEMIAVKGGKVVFVDETANELWVTGTVPGKAGAVVAVKKVKPGNFVGLKNIAEPKAVLETKIDTETETEE